MHLARSPPWVTLLGRSSVTELQQPTIFTFHPYVGPREAICSHYCTTTRLFVSVGQQLPISPSPDLGNLHCILFLRMHCLLCVKPYCPFSLYDWLVLLNMLLTLILVVARGRVTFRFSANSSPLCTHTTFCVHVEMNARCPPFFACCE